MKMKKMRVMVAILILLVAAASTARAGSTLHIGFGSGTACATGCGGHPNLSGGPVASPTFDVFQNSGGANPIVDPLLLILGVPDQSSPTFFSNSSIVDLITISPYPDTGSSTTTGSPPNDWNYGSSAFGLDGNGFQGSFTTGEVYSFLGLTGTNASNNFGNWHEALGTHVGIDATSFGIYVFELFADPGTLDFEGHSLIDIVFANETTVPIGTYLLPYAQDSDGKAFSSPFTEIGLVTNGPEFSDKLYGVPNFGWFLSFGGGLLGMVVTRRKHSSRG